MKLHELLNMSIGISDIILKQGDKVIYYEDTYYDDRYNILNEYGEREIEDIGFMLSERRLVIVIK